MKKKPSHLEYSILGLTELESAIFNFLKDSEATMSEISIGIKVPRTTLYTPLSTLKNRGLIFTKKHGKYLFISKVAESEIRKTLEHMFNKTYSEQQITISDAIGFSILTGKDALVSAWRNVALSKHRRILVMQSTASMLSALKLLDPKILMEVNNSILKNKIIIETVLREDYYRSYMKFWEKHPNTQRGILNSLIGRMADTSLISNAYLKSNSEMIISGDTAYLLDWETETGIKIKNEGMISFLKELFELSRGYGKKVDQNNILRELRAEI